MFDWPTVHEQGGCLRLLGRENFLHQAADSIEPLVPNRTPNVTSQLSVPRRQLLADSHHRFRRQLTLLGVSNRPPMSASILRAAARGGRPATTFFRANTIRSAAPQPLSARAAIVLPTLVALPSANGSFSTSARLRAEHQEETFEEFSARYATARRCCAGATGLGRAAPGTGHARNGRTSS